MLHLFNSLREKLAVLRWQEGAARRQNHAEGLKQLQERASRGSPKRFLEVLQAAGMNAPQQDDEILNHTE